MHKKPDIKDIVYMLHAQILPTGAEAPAVLSVPYADTPYNRDGIKGVNRLNKEIAAAMVIAFAELQASDPRYAPGMPFYVGHPDYFGPQKEEYVKFVREQPPAVGWIKSIEAGDSAMLLHVEWNPRGKKLIEDKEFLFFSPNIPSYLGGSENGVNIYIPLYLKSAGLTNTPNWSVSPMVHAGDGNPGEIIQEESTTMMLLDRIKALMGDESIQTEDDAVGAIGKMIDVVQRWRKHLDEKWKIQRAVETALPHAACDIMVEIEGICTAAVEAVHNATDHRTKFEELQKAYATEMVHAAVERGSILQDHAASRIEDLIHSGDSFLAKVTEVKALPKLMKTETIVHTETAAEREGAATTVSSDPTAEAVAMVHSRMDSDKVDFRTAFNSVAAERPELFGGDKAEG